MLEVKKLEKIADFHNNNSNNIDFNHTHPVRETHLKEFPYPLTCKKSELYNFLERNKLIDRKTGERQEHFNVAISLHVGMVNNWKLILEDQITTLKECGLLGIAATPLMISYSNGLLSDLFRVLNPLLGSDGANKTISTVESTGVPWESPAMNMIHQYCNEQEHRQTTVVFYIHNKGASKWHPSWREQIDANETWTYGHSLYWRKYLEYFLIERPALCLDKILLQNASTCAANWHPTLHNHYSGNFWSASCKHIQRLERLKDSNYVAAEFWLGSYAGLQSNQEHHTSLHTTYKNLYEELIKPDEYVISGVSNE